MTRASASHPKASIPQSALKFLKPSDVGLIEGALEKAGPSGELHLIVENGQLRYISILQTGSNGDHSQTVESAVKAS